MLKLLIFFILSNTGLRGHEFKLYEPQARLDIRQNFFLQSELLMSGIACLRQYCTVIHYQHLRKNLTAFYRIGDTIKLFSFFPLVIHLSRWLVKLS